MKIKNVVEWLEETVRWYPDKVAFSDGMNYLTFEQLRLEAISMAAVLCEKNIFRKPIVVALGKHPGAISAFMAAAYSGNYYVPLDIRLPDERKQAILDIVEPAVVIDNEFYCKNFRRPITNADLGSIERALAEQIDTDLLYVLFTSGSTGTPKGVPVSHRAVLDYITEIKDVFGFSDKDVYGQSVPLHFGSSILSVYQTLMNGSTTYLIPVMELMCAADTVEFLNRYMCNTIYWVPTSYSVVANSNIFKTVVPRYLKKCLFVGEVMPVSVLNTWRKALPDAMFANLMGPTEYAGTYLYYKVDREFNDGESLPIGNHYKNAGVLILNEYDQQCKTGEAGELCIRGGKIAAGYYKDFEKTAKAFVQNPLNSVYPELIYRTGDLGYVNDRGEIMFVGRKDFQIKHSGYRIELGDIENAVMSVHGVELCGCVYDASRAQITLFYQGDLSQDTLKRELRVKLPKYMIPGRFEQLKEIPKTSSGKVSRMDLKTLL